MRSWRTRRRRKFCSQANVRSIFHLLLYRRSFLPSCLHQRCRFRRCGTNNSIPVGRQNFAHPQIQQLGDGAVFESSDKILPWFCCSGTPSDGLLLRSVPARTSSSKTLPCVSNCWLSTPNNLGADSLPYTSCSGSDCEDSGRNGRSLSSWLHPEPLSAGMAPAFGCIGNGSPELDQPEAEKLSAKRFGR